jgi:mono/diheme cytochrome c family protein
VRSLLIALIAAFGILLGMAELRAAQVATNAGTPSPGDIARGQALFEGKGECLSCHRVQNRGSRFGPDLTDIGSRAGSVTSRGTASPFAPPAPDIGPAGRAHAELTRSLLDPGADILPQNRTVRLVTTTGETITARVLNQDTFSLQVIDTSERVRSIPKIELREFAFIKTSAMPSYRDKFSPQELADVIAYLMSLKGINK